MTKQNSQHFVNGIFKTENSFFLYSLNVDATSTVGNKVSIGLVDGFVPSGNPTFTTPYSITTWWHLHEYI